MIRPIVCYGSPVLRRKAEPVDLKDPNLSALIADLWETMRGADGVGLAAPQIGVSKQIFVVDARALQKPDETPFQGVFINPEITWYSEEKFEYEEGCLSIPGVREKVWRPASVRVRYWDENGQSHEAVFSGIVGRIIQHEYDHLMGRLFIDHLPALRRQLLRSKLHKIRKGLIETPYPVSYAL